MTLDGSGLDLIGSLVLFWVLQVGCSLNMILFFFLFGKIEFKKICSCSWSFIPTQSTSHDIFYTSLALLSPHFCIS